MQAEPARAGTITQRRGMDAAAGDAEAEGRRPNRQVELTEAEGQQRLVVDRRRRESDRGLAQAEVHRAAQEVEDVERGEVTFGSQNRGGETNVGRGQRGLRPVDGGGR